MNFSWSIVNQGIAALQFDILLAYNTLPLQSINERDEIRSPLRRILQNRLEDGRRIGVLSRLPEFVCGQAIFNHFADYCTRDQSQAFVIIIDD